MSLDILTADVGKHNIVAVRLRFQDQGAFTLLPAFSEKTRSEMKTELQWHVEPRQTRGADLHT